MVSFSAQRFTNCFPDFPKLSVQSNINCAISPTMSQTTVTQEIEISPVLTEMRNRTLPSTNLIPKISIAKQKFLLISSYATCQKLLFLDISLTVTPSQTKTSNFQTRTTIAIEALASDWDCHRGQQNKEPQRLRSGGDRKRRTQRAEGSLNFEAEIKAQKVTSTNKDQSKGENIIKVRIFLRNFKS